MPPLERARLHALEHFGKRLSMAERISIQEAEGAERPVRVADFDYDLPEELIAQQPPAERGTSRMLVMDRATGALRRPSSPIFRRCSARAICWSQRQPRDSRAALRAAHTGREREKPTGRIEVMLTEPAGENRWRALVRPGRKVAIGERLVFPAPAGEIALEAEVLERGEFGERLLDLPRSTISSRVLDRIGHMPLPPYIHRDDADARSRTLSDGLCARARLCRRANGGPALYAADARFACRKGVEIARVTLHVGLGTFAPLRVERVDEVRLHRERYTICT